MISLIEVENAHKRWLVLPLNLFMHFEPTNTLSKIHPKNYNNSPPHFKILDPRLIQLFKMYAKDGPTILLESFKSLQGILSNPVASWSRKKLVFFLLHCAEWTFFGFKPTPWALKLFAIYQYTFAECYSRYIGKTCYFATEIKEYT